MFFSSINSRVHHIKDKQNEIDKLIEEYKPFIASCVKKKTGKNFGIIENDEMSIALIAFSEAINSYEKHRGNFLVFAQNVINRRLIDYFRKEIKYTRMIADVQPDEGTNELDYTLKEAMSTYQKSQEAENRRIELEQLKIELTEWDISFLELVKISPKSKKTKADCKKILEFILTSQEVSIIIKHKKYLPIKEISLTTGIQIKKIERIRKYLIAVFLIHMGDYDIMKEYIKII